MSTSGGDSSSIFVESGPGSKISALAAAAALDGTELAVIVQSGADVQTTTQDIADLGGGGGAGAPVVRRFAFTFATANLGTGATICTPTINDILLDAWIEVDTAFDGTTPLADIGSFVGSHFGFWGSFDRAIDMTTADGETPPGLLAASAWSSLGATSQLSLQGATFLDIPNTIVALGRVAPGKFTSADPIKLVVSQNGKDNGAAAGAAQGAGSVYLVTATPV